MSEVWWGKESLSNRRVRLKPVIPPLPPVPELSAPSRQDVKNELRSRIRSFTPEWTNLRTTDAGMALVQLFSEQLEPVLERLNRLPEKTFVEFLNVAGIKPLQASPAAALLEFEVSDTAPQSVFVGKGFQASAQSAEGPDDLVVFETERDLVAAPAKIVEMHVQEDNLFQSIDPQAENVEGFLPFGSRPEPGRALFIGFASNITPGPTISLGIRVAAPPGAPPPSAAGGVAPLPVSYAPQLEWSVLDGTKFLPAEIVLDETGGFIHSGVVELRLPREWRVGRPTGLSGKPPLRWLRLEVVSGTFAESPVLASIKPNMVPASAARTIFNEALEPLPQSRNRQMSLSQKPILPDSLIIEVDEGGFDVSSGPEANVPVSDGNAKADPRKKSKTRRWKQVDDLGPYGPDDEVYVLDPLEGVVTFGEGVHGAPIPQGFRNVRAQSYRVGGGGAGAVKAGAISTLLSSAPFISKVVNPWPATGGLNRETTEQAMRRGPQEIRARSRAVTVADYALLARQAQGALVARAHAVAGLHPSFPGRSIPGVVGVFVVPPDRNEGPPTADEDTLRAVATHLSKNAAPAGVEVVAAAARFHKVKVEAAITIRTGADSGKTVRDALKVLDEYLHPLTGGEDGSGWPFGGTLRYQSLVLRLTNIDEVSAVPTLNIIADGTRFLACQDFVPEAHALLWGEIHQVIVQQRKETG
ncbi:MAG TPA: putative baseplate assembly protein [Pyrinomonadaceae bacterium]|nr:putative baseplate assembly protein [Pyrinomonadaceae bacterium]